MKTLVLAQAASTLPLIGLIWTIQVVHYPLFSRVGETAFQEYHVGHSARITLIVLPLMVVELISAALLVLRSDPPPGAWLGACLVGVIWLSTFFLQVPRHSDLSSGFDAAAHQFLVQSNWLRTLAWSARGALVLWWLARS